MQTTAHTDCKPMMGWISLAGCILGATLLVSCNQCADCGACDGFIAPAITQQPQAQSVTVGDSATFSVAATEAENDSANIVWQVSKDSGGKWSAVDNALAGYYTTPAVTPEMNGWLYRANINKNGGMCQASALSQVARLTVNDNGGAPLFADSGQPAAQTVSPGHTATFTVAANAASGYQWQVSKDSGASWTNVTAGAGGATNVYTTPAATLDMSGWRYRAQARNAAGFTESRAVTLTVPGNTLNPSGMNSTQCYAAHSDALIACSDPTAAALNAQQDGMRTGAFNFSKIDAFGFVLANSAPAWNCILDNTSGLMWEVKTRDGSWRDREMIFANYDNFAVGNKQDGGETPVDASESQYPGSPNSYKNSVNSSGLCGYKDWRLPTPLELQGIMNYSGAGTKAIDTLWFPDVTWTYPNVALYYWSSSPRQGSTNQAWYALLNQGSLEADYRYFVMNVRLVRGGAAAPQSCPHIATATRYIFSTDSDGTALVSDQTTGLTWKRCAEGQTWNNARCSGAANNSFSQEAALIRARDASHPAGSPPWRLPNVKELASLIESACAGPATLDTTAFPSASGDNFISSTPYAASSAPGVYDKAWSVNFADGSVGFDSRKGRNVGGRVAGYAVRLVRDDR